MPDVTMDPAVLARGRVRAMVRERLEDREALGTGTDVASAIADDLMADTNFLASAIRPALVSMAREILAQLLSKNRDLVLTGDLVQPRHQARSDAARMAAFRGWYESSKRGLVQIGAMRKDDLLEAATKRRAAAGTNLRRALLLEQLADRMGSEQTVEEVFTQEQIRELADAIESSPDAPSFLP